MSFEEQSKLIETIFKTGWAARTAVAWDNQPFNEPAPATGTAWVRFSIRAGDTLPASVGRTMSRTRGIAYLQIFVPKNSGNRVAKGHAEFFRGIFRHERIQACDGVIVFDEISCQDSGDTGEWRQTLGIAPFRQDEFFAP